MPMKFFKVTTLILLVFMLSSYSLVHKYYISNTQIEYVKSKQSVQIITRVFMDDFENVLKARYDASLNFDESTDETIHYYIGKYLTEKFKIKIDNSEKAITYLGKELEMGIVKCYLEIEGIASITTLEVTNQTLFDLFEEQQNIIKLDINSKKKSFVLTKQNDNALLNFN